MHVYIRQAYRQTDRQTDRHTDRQTDRNTDRQTDRHTDRQTDRQTDRPEIAEVTFPPKDSTTCLALSLPRLSPAPPPSSGKMPVITTVLPLGGLRLRCEKSERGVRDVM